jgi:hypothetical protein
MKITLGEATKLLDNIMTNYSQWHTEQTPTGKKVNSVEEINTLSDKMDALLKLVASKSAHIDPNDCRGRIHEHLWDQREAPLQFGGGEDRTKSRSSEEHD